MDNKDNGKTLLQRFWFLNQGFFIWSFISLLISALLIIIVFACNIFPGAYSWFCKNWQWFVGIVFGSFSISWLIQCQIEWSQRKKKKEKQNENKIPFWPYEKIEDNKETFILPFSSKQYPFDAQQNAQKSIKWRGKVLEDIKALLDTKASLVIYGKSGYGKSTILWQFLKFINGTSLDIPKALNDYIQKIQKDYPVFRSQVVKANSGKETDKYTFLLLDQIDELKEEELTMLLEKAKNCPDIDKVLLCAKTDALAMVSNAYFTVNGEDLSAFGIYCLKPDADLIDDLSPCGNGETASDDSTAKKIMKRLCRKLQNGEHSLIEYQFINRLYLNDLLDKIIEKLDTDQETALVRDPELINRLAVYYFMKKLEQIPCETYIAYLSFLRILSDNKPHNINDEAKLLTMCSADELKQFAENLKAEHLLTCVDRVNSFRVSHEWVGTMFRHVTHTLLSGECIDTLDTSESGLSKYKKSLKTCFSDYNKPIWFWWWIIPIVVIITLIQNLHWFSRSFSNLSTTTLPFEEIGFQLAANITVYIGILYMGNFYRYCVNMKKKQCVWMYLFGLLAAILPLLPSIVPLSPQFNFLGLIGFALANASIGIFYRVNRKDREINASEWLRKKGNLFFWIGILLALGMGGLWVVARLLTSYLPGTTWMYVSFIILYLAYSAFIYFAIKNYIHFQSLAVQRLRIAMKLNPSGTK